MTLQTVGFEQTSKFGQETNGTLARLMLSLALLLVSLSLLRALSFPAEINLDSALLIQLAKAVLNGKELYVSVVEFNTPLSIFMHVLPLWFSSAARIPLIPAFDICVTLTAFASVLLCYCIQRYATTEKNSALATILALALFQLFAAYDFGQREHIFVLLAAPFFLLRCYRYSGENFPVLLSACVGVCAGLGISIKPHFAMPLLFSELILLGKARCLKKLICTETACALAALGAEALYLFMMSPEAKSNYFSVLIPLVSAGYQAENSSVWVVSTLQNARLLGALAVLAVTLAIRLRSNSIILLPACGFILGAYLEFVLQQKNWSYHLLPFFYGVILLASMESMVIVDACLRGFSRGKQISFLKRMINLSKVLIVSTFLICIYFGFKSVHALSTNAPSRTIYALETQLKRYTSAGDSVAIIDTEDSYSEVLVRLNLNLGYRYASLWPIVFVEGQNLSAAQVHSWEKSITQQVIDDIKKYQPVVVAIYAVHNKFTPHDFVLAKTLAKYGFYQDGLRNYKLIDHCDNFEIWKQNNPQVAPNLVPKR